MITQYDQHLVCLLSQVSRWKQHKHKHLQKKKRIAKPSVIVIHVSEACYNAIILPERLREGLFKMNYNSRILRQVYVMKRYKQTRYLTFSFARFESGCILVFIASKK